jgi:hypothetical protein
MPHSRLSREEIGRRGQERYERDLRERLETDENIGKIVCIDVETGDYEVAKDGLTAGGGYSSVIQMLRCSVCESVIMPFTPSVDF